MDGHLPNWLLLRLLSGGGADASTLNWVYNLADYVNKIAFGVIIWAAAKADTSKLNVLIKLKGNIICFPFSQMKKISTKNTSNPIIAIFCHHPNGWISIRIIKC